MVFKHKGIGLHCSARRCAASSCLPAAHGRPVRVEAHAQGMAHARPASRRSAAAESTQPASARADHCARDDGVDRLHPRCTARGALCVRIVGRQDGATLSGPVPHGSVRSFERPCAGGRAERFQAVARLRRNGLECMDDASVRRPGACPATAGPGGQGAMGIRASRAVPDTRVRHRTVTRAGCVIAGPVYFARGVHAVEDARRDRQALLIPNRTVALH